MSGILERVRRALEREIERQGPTASTLSVQGGELWITGEARLDLAALASVAIRATTKHSIDDAVAEIERRLPGWWWTVGWCEREVHARVCPPDLDHDGFEAFGETPAQALMKALAAADPLAANAESSRSSSS